MPHTKLNAFIEKFSPHLRHTRRWDAFLFIAGEILSDSKPAHILETGCLRTAGNWEGDGQSTAVWDYLVTETGGHGISVDLNEQAVTTANTLCPRMIVVPNDSITVLRSLALAKAVEVGFINSLSLLYLDSFDYIHPGYDAMLHHVGELACVYDKLPVGCLIAVDDCHSDTAGKHVMVKAFFDLMGVQPVLNGYVTVWRKP